MSKSQEKRLAVQTGSDTATLEDAISALDYSISEGITDERAAVIRSVLTLSDATIATLRAEVERLKDDTARGLRRAYDLTLETQTVDEAVADLVRLVRSARAERDESLGKVERLQAERLLMRAECDGQIAYAAGLVVERDEARSDLARLRSERETARLDAIRECIAAASEATGQESPYQARLVIVARLEALALAAKGGGT